MADYAEGQLLAERFEIIGVLGRGGMATVYLARDRVRGRRVALKVLHAHLADQPSMQARLRREIEAASRLRHPAALVAWELHDLDGAWALSMPFHPGQTLGEAVASGQRLSPEALRELGERLASALAEAHRAGVLHGDVSPANVMLGGDGAVLTDFGLARFQDRRSQRSTGVMGTAGYTAPEVYEGARADPRSDLYSLGATLYLAATGREPFAADNPVGVLQRQLEDRIEPLESLRPDLPESLSQTITALLWRDPAARPAGARELAEALASGSPPELALPVPARPAPAVRSHLPQGDWRVAVSGQPGADSSRRGRHRRRHRRRGRRRQRWTGIGRVDQALDQVATGLEAGIQAGLEAMGGVESSASLLTAEVAELAALPADGLRVPPVLNEPRFRLVDGVDEASAEALAGIARSLGYTASASELRRLPAPFDAVPAMLGPLVGVMWVCFPFLVAYGLNPLIMLPLFISLSILLPVARRSLGQSEASRWPLAFGRDLRPLATAEVRARLPAVGEGAGAATRPVAPAPAAPEDRSRTGGLAARAKQQLDALVAAVGELDTLPSPAARDLRGTAAQLRGQVETLAASAGRIEAELEGADAGGADAELSWMEDRLRRLETLRRAGDPVDAEERGRLQAALDAHRRAQEIGADLERQLTAALARLLEIATTASRVRRELLAQPDLARSAELLVGRLQREAAAATESLEETEQRRSAARLKQRE